MTGTDFRSDNVAPVAPQIMAAIQAANAGTASSYGADEASSRLDALFSDLFGREVAVVPVATGTAANALALSMLVPPYGAIYCHDEAHILLEECGAPEFYCGAAKLVPVTGAHGRIEPDALRAAIDRVHPGDVHMMPPSAVSLTQANECGTVYSPGQVRALAGLAKERGLAVHMDGARFANAVAALGCAPAEITWKAGVDILSFGATKNGCLAAEAVVMFDPARRDELLFRRKRGGHLWSKTRFLAAQLEAYLKDGLWLDLAGRANAAAARLSAGLAGIPGIESAHPTEANEVFVHMAPALSRALMDEGFAVHPWGAPGGTMVRAVCAFDTGAEAADGLVAAAGRLSRQPLRRG